MIIMDTMNYSKCPLKKRPVHIADQELEQCEPENLSTKPEDLSSRYHSERKSSSPRRMSTDRVVPIHIPKPIFPSNCESKFKDEHLMYHMPYHPEMPEFHIKPWHAPLTPPMYPYPVKSENIEPAAFHTYTAIGREPQPFKYCTEDSLFKSQMPLCNPYATTSMDLRTSFSHPIHKSEPKRFTPYRVDQHRPLFNVYPLSPASSQASYNSYESPRRSVSPVSTTSSTSDSLNSSYSIFRDVSALSVVDTTVAASSIPTRRPSSNDKQQQQHQQQSPKNAHYQCRDCSKSYSTHSGLSKHLQFHCPAVEGNQAKKHFSCKNCDKVYTSLGALKMHIRTHTLPCKCDICGKAFSRPWLLQGHIRTHTGEKPFSCQHCHRAFADRSNLRAHLQTHSDVKKYSCTTCSKTFSRMSLLTKHLEVGCSGLPLNHSLGLSLNQIMPTKADISVY